MQIHINEDFAPLFFSMKWLLLFSFVFSLKLIICKKNLLETYDPKNAKITNILLNYSFFYVSVFIIVTKLKIKTLESICALLNLKV